MLVKDLYKAIENNDNETTLSLLNLREIQRKINQRVGKWGSTCLHLSCSKGNMVITRVLLRCGADPNVKDKDYNAPIHCAALKGQDGCLSLLSAPVYKCDINSRNGAGNTALHFSAYWGYKNCVDTLLEQDLCEIDLFNNRGKTPLHEASQRGHLDIVKMLVNHGADIYNKVCQMARTREKQIGKTAYDLAQDNSRYEMTSYLKSLMDKDKNKEITGKVCIFLIQ